MPPRVRNTFERLERRLQRHFSGDLLLWWPASDGDADYTVPITCRQTDDRGESKDMAGLLSMDAGTITLQAGKAAFPFVPDENMTFMFGPSDGAEPPAFTASAQKFQITSVSGPEMFSHYTIQARRH